MHRTSIFDNYPILKTIPKDKFPKHVLIIPDGNGRWAQQENKFVLHGHKRGAENINAILRDLSELTEIRILTLWGFASDNWKRSEEEINGLFTLMQFQLKSNITELQSRQRRFIHLGRKDRLPKVLLQAMEKAERETLNNPGQIICAAVDFGGEDQELRVIEKARELPEGTSITKEILWQLRDTGGLIPAADLLIRTSGERRTSDIGWLNGSSTELYFLEKYFPDITTADIVNALVDFSKRERRFGGRK